MADFLQSPSGQTAVVVLVSTPVAILGANGVTAGVNHYTSYSSVSGAGSLQMSIPFGDLPASTFPSTGQQWPLGATLIATISGTTGDPEIHLWLFAE